MSDAVARDGTLQEMDTVEPGTAAALTPRVGGPQGCGDGMSHAGPDESSGASAELAIVKKQRDALAQVVTKVWNNARDAYETDAPEVEDLMTESGLADRYGDGLIRLTELGRAALQAGPG